MKEKAAQRRLQWGGGAAWRQRRAWGAGGRSQSSLPLWMPAAALTHTPELCAPGSLSYLDREHWRDMADSPIFVSPRLAQHCVCLTIPE